MTKKNLMITIEEDVLQKAKKQIPNISEFLNECLKQYLGLADGIYQTANANDIINQIGRLQAELHIINTNYDYEKAQKEMEEEKINRALRGIWNEYRKHLDVDDELMSETLMVLPVDDAEKLEDMLDFAYEYQEELGLNFTWEQLFELYEKEGM